MSAFRVCQVPDCTEIAEYECSCPRIFCSSHYRYCIAQEGTGHEFNHISRPLEEDGLGMLNEVNISIVTKELIEREFKRKNESINILLNKIKQIEDDYLWNLKHIIKIRENIKEILSEIKNKRLIPLNSSNYLASQIADMLMNKDDSILLRQLYFDQVDAKYKEYLPIAKEYENNGTKKQIEEEDSTGEEEKKVNIEIRDTNHPLNLKELWQYQAQSGASSSIWTIAVSPCTALIASGGGDNTIKIWNSDCGNLITTLKRHSAPVTTVNFNSSGTLLVSGSNDKSAVIWDLETFSPLKTYEKHSNWILSACFSENSEFVVSGCEDGSIHIWRLEEASTIFVLNKHQVGVTSLIFSRDGQKIVSGSGDGKVIIWDANSDSPLHIIEASCGWINTLSLYNQLLACGGEREIISLWDIGRTELVGTLEGHSGSIFSIDFFSSGEFIVSSSSDDCIRIWKLQERETIAIISGVSFPKVLIIGNKIVSGDDDGTIRVWTFGAYLQ